MKSEHATRDFVIHVVNGIAIMAVTALFTLCAQLQISGLFLRQRVTLHLVVPLMALSVMELGS